MMSDFNQNYFSAIDNSVFDGDFDDNTITLFETPVLMKNTSNIHSSSPENAILVQKPLKEPLRKENLNVHYHNGLY